MTMFASRTHSYITCGNWTVDRRKPIFNHVLECIIIHPHQGSAEGNFSGGHFDCAKGTGYVAADYINSLGPNSTHLHKYAKFT